MWGAVGTSPGLVSKAAAAPALSRAQRFAQTTLKAERTELASCSAARAKREVEVAESTEAQICLTQHLNLSAGCTGQALNDKDSC